MTEKTSVVWQVDGFSERREWTLPIPRRMLSIPIPVRRTTPRTCAGLGLDLWKHNLEAEASLSRGPIPGGGSKMGKSDLCDVSTE
jgi:hypothetical protein